ncbi:MAG: AMP-binding protein [Alphaproteobacteria bacterium]|nr:AMP-binding protein [Alphaproteobacteria bacterium]
MSDISGAYVEQSALLTVGDLLLEQARHRPQAIAIEDGVRQWTFAQFNARVNRLANSLSQVGIERGDRIAVLSENRVEYLEVTFAAAKLGAIFCALNWRLAAAELEHCVRLATPKLAFVSERFSENFDALDSDVEEKIRFGDPYESLLADACTNEPTVAVDPEDGLVIIYTSGTTGLPKGALISHRAEIARMQSSCIDFGLAQGDAFVAWPPMFHMASTDQSISALCLGSKVVVVDGFDVERLVDIVAAEKIWWLILMPGMIEPFAKALKRRNAKPHGITLIGAMADLVPRHQIAEITTLLQAPYANTFGSTETGLPPASAALIPIGVTPNSLSKVQSAMCLCRLVDPHDNDVPDGHVGEMAVRGPTLFSGYWNAPKANEEDFRGGWFHMGDAFRRNADGTLDFVDRVKYLIKSGGENIYPAEIEQILLREPRVDDAVVVRAPDEKWGEVPVAFVAANDPSLTAAHLAGLCREALAGYKQPKQIRFIALDDLPRSTTGKIQRHEVEKWLTAESKAP